MKAKLQAKEAKEAAVKFGNVSTKVKNLALKNVGLALKKNQKKIISENKKDLAYGEKENIGKSLLKRLKVDESKLNEIIEYVNGVEKQVDPVGNIATITELDTHLNLTKISCPIGVIGVIFESRPDALAQIASLCLKSSNSVILKGGKEALNTNKILFEIIKKETEKIKEIPKGWIQLIETREAVKAILKLDDYIDLVIPRGSNSFVKYIQDNTRISVLGHSSGICHVYVDKEADIKKAVEVSFDAKCQYPAVCNAMETLLVNKEIAKKFFDKMIKKYLKAGVELRLDEGSLKIVKIKDSNIKKATSEDWGTEYNDLILSIKLVKDYKEAIDHINKYGSGHTDAIVTENEAVATDFINLVDSGSVFWNTSTRFSDGFRYGLGAEVGISTNKIHARGPVGLEGLVIYKYILKGKGHTVMQYSKGKKFTHKKIK